jgi:hypothetical protein
VNQHPQLGRDLPRSTRRIAIRLTSALAVTLVVGAAFAAAGLVGHAQPPVSPRFEISFAPSAHAEAVTGRVYVAIARADATPPQAPAGRGGQGGGPIQQAGPTGNPMFGKNVDALKPGEAAVIDGSVFGHPLASLRDLPAGDYLVQAFVNVYTRFPRADGHTVWLHMDQWEGQNWRRSPGNMFSAPMKVHVDPAAGAVIKLVCDQVIPPLAPLADTDSVKHIKLQSTSLSKWWGQPMFIGATVLLPKDYDKHPEAHYPVNYEQGHFSTGAPGGFGRGSDFDRLWLAEDTPRFIYVTFQHPSPYYDDSYAVNSENDGPYGDAIMQELIPAVEKQFRVIREPWARKLSGGSTGGWESLALQVFHPDFFGGTWSSCPDPVDFRCHQIVNVYSDDNAYFIDRGWTKVERPNNHRPDGTISSMMKDENWFELVQGDHSRSGGQWDIWEATFSPVAPDGYPKRIWEKQTGKIDHDVAAYWKEHYDLRSILETQWATLGPKLAGKIHVYVGDQDSYYLNNAVGMLEAFLVKTTNPAYDGEVKYERLRPHCWGPRAAELIPMMTAHIEKYAPAGADLKSWRYK